MIKKTGVWLVGWRLVLWLIVITSVSWLPFRAGQDFTRLSNIHPYLSAWANFDGIHYLQIASNGYTDQARFLPFYPMIIRSFLALMGLGSVIKETHLVIALIASHLFWWGSIWMLSKLLALDYPQSVVTKASWALLLFPTSFFLVSVYSESLFLFLSLLVWYWARQHRWWLAALAASLLTITRLPGILIWPPLAYEWWSTIGKDGGWRRFLSGWWLVIIPLPLMSYIYFNWLKWHQPLYFIQAHAQLANSRSVTGVVWPPQTIYRYGHILLTLSPGQYEWWLAGMELLISVAAGGLLIYAFRQKVRLSYLIYASLIFLLPVFSGTLSGMPRYSLVIFPIFISWALIDNKWISLGLYVTSGILLTIILGVFTRGYFVS